MKSLDQKKICRGCGNSHSKSIENFSLGHWGKQAEKFKSQRGGGVLWNTVFQTWHGNHTHQLKVAVFACAQPTQEQANLNVSMEWGGVLKPHPPLLSEELLAVTATEEESHFPLPIWPMAGSPHPRAQPHTNTHMASTNWTQWDICD